MFRLSNLFILGLVLITGLNSYLSIFNAETGTQEFNGSVRIIQKEPTKFGIKYLIWTQQGPYYLDTKNYYNLGDEYEIQGVQNDFKSKVSNNAFGFGIQETNLNPGTITQNTALTASKFDPSEYYLSGGVLGSITKEKLISKTILCDFYCSSLKNIDYLKKYLVGVYNKQVCGSFIYLSTWLGLDCRRSLAWSLGLTFGLGDYFTPADKLAIKNLGITHLVVVSGSQVGLIFAALDWLGIKLWIRRKWRVLICMFGILFLVVIIGPQAPVLRSSLSVLISCISLVFFGIKLNPIRALIYSGVFLLWFNPFFILSYSFWLSFAATFGLIMTTNTNEMAEIAWLKDWVQLGLSTIGTFLYTLPLIVNLAGGFSPWAIVSNILLLPIIPFLTLANLLAFVPVVGELGILFATIVQTLMNFLIGDFGSQIQLWQMDKFGIIEILIYWLILTLAIFALRRILKNYFTTHSKNT